LDINFWQNGALDVKCHAPVHLYKTIGEIFFKSVNDSSPCSGHLPKVLKSQGLFVVIRLYRKSCKIENVHRKAECTDTNPKIDFFSQDGLRDSRIFGHGSIRVDCNQRNAEISYRRSCPDSGSETHIVCT